MAARCCNRRSAWFACVGTIEPDEVTVVWKSQLLIILFLGRVINLILRCVAGVPHFVEMVGVCHDLRCAWIKQPKNLLKWQLPFGGPLHPFLCRGFLEQVGELTYSSS